jgi:hypothetical protein
MASPYSVMIRELARIGVCSWKRVIRWFKGVRDDMGVPGWKKEKEYTERAHPPVGAKLARDSVVSVNNNV